MSTLHRYLSPLASSRFLVRLGAGAPGLFLVACSAVGRDFEPPQAQVPASWREADSAGLAQRDTDLAAWWRRLGDPTLDGLVERALSQGLDVREALARVREARALRGAAGAERLPTLDASTSFSRQGESQNTPFGSFVPDSDLYSVGLDAAWEVDLWGRIRRSVEAAEADFAASVEDSHAVAVTVAAETALHYVRLCAFQQRLSIALTNVALQEQTLALVRARYEAGLIGERDVAQATANVASTRSRVPALESGLRAEENRLALLLGLAPGELAAELSLARPIPVAPIEIAVGLPADLVRRRPDVRRAERILAAETARIGVAEGELYPKLALSGNLGFEADDLSELFTDPSSVFGIVAPLRWRLFDGGRLRERVEAQDARTEQALVRWERAVLTALAETENAMTAFVREQARRRSLVEAATQARRAAELAQTQYSEGLTDFQTVLDSERALAAFEDELAESEAAITTGLIALYKALGGGWETVEACASPAAP